MNIRLSVYADRVHKKKGYITEVTGRVIDKKIRSFEGDNIKENALSMILKGLLSCRNRVSHEDVIIVEVQNQHLTSWLNGFKEYKEYAEYLDSIFEVIENLDCRYRFVFVSKPSAKDFVSFGSVSTMVENTVSVDSMFDDFE